MRVQVKPFHELGSVHGARWRAIQDSSQRFASPYFSLEFSAAVNRARRDVRVAVLGPRSEPVGYFPFHVSRTGFGRPVGLGLSDHHGVLVREGEDWTAAELMASCGISYFPFDHLIASQQAFAPHVASTELSPLIELPEGGSAYFEGHRRAGSKQWKKVRNLRRRLEREHGEVRFVVSGADSEALRTLFDWKTAQCRACGGVEYPRIPWVRQLLRDLMGVHAGTFRGILSCLFVEDALVAAHLGMIDQGTWHYWLPGYTEDLAKYSPGLVLLGEMIAAAAELGVVRIDMGKGADPYKLRIANAGIEIATGEVVVPGVAGRCVRGFRRARDLLGASSPGVGGLLDRLAERVRRSCRYG